MSLTEIKLIIAALMLAGSAAVGAWGMHHWDLADYRELQNQIAQAKIDAQNLTIERQQAFDQLAAKDGELQAARAAKITDQTEVSKGEVIRYVTTTKLCVPVALMRMLDATANGASVDSLSVAGGKSSDGCAAVASIVRLIENIGRFNLNGSQLNALSHSVRAAHEISEGMQPKRR